MQTGNGYATGKIILMGEHSVVYGEPAIAFPFAGTCVHTQITASPINSLFSSYYQGPLADAPNDLTTIKELLQRLQSDSPTPNCQLTIESTIPAERGMGSSAAIAVAITRAFFDWQKIHLTASQLLDYVNFSEKIAHGNPSGIDAAATSGNEAIYFTKGEPFVSFPLTINAYLIVADTGIKGQTRAAVKSVSLLTKEDPAIIADIHKLGTLTRQAKEAIYKNQLDVLGQAMTNAHFLLQKLTVSNNVLDTFVALALHNGALGAKLTGGGRGGCMIALTKDKETAESICQILQTHGAKATWVQGLGACQYV